MTRKFLGLAALAVSLFGLTVSAGAQTPGKIKIEGPIGEKTLKFIYMSPQAIACAGWYPGSDHSGGGVMSCMARYEYIDVNGNVLRTEDVNVSDKAAWSIDDTEVYWIEEDVTMFSDGLWVNPYFLDIADGFTYVRATFEGHETAGEIQVNDYRQ